MSIAALGAIYYRSTTKYEPGQLSSVDIFNNKKIGYSSYGRPGVGLVDIVDKRRTRLDYLPPRRKNVGNDELFGYISLTEQEARQHINDLQVRIPPILHVIDPQPNDRTRYGILDPVLKEFVSFCIITLGNLEWKLQYAWLYKRPIRKFMKDAENKWYTRLYGSDQKGLRVTSYLWNLMRKRKDFRKMDGKRQRELIVHADKTIRQFDESIKRSYGVIMSQRYRSVQNTYSLVTDPLLEVVYPQFLRSDLNLC